MKLTPVWFTHMIQKIGKCQAWSIFQALLQELPWISHSRQNKSSAEIQLPSGDFTAQQPQTREFKTKVLCLTPEAPEFYTHWANKLQPVPRAGPCLDAWLIVNAQGKSSAARSYLGGKQQAGVGRQTAESWASTSTEIARTASIQNITL